MEDRKSSELLDVEREATKRTNRMAFTTMMSIVALVVTTVSGYIMFALNTWVSADYIPEKNLHYVAVQIFQKQRDMVFKDFSDKWTDMRLGYGAMMRVCQSHTTLTPVEKVKFFQQNDASVRAVIESGVNLSYYFGRAIRDITVQELQWYITHSAACPTKKNVEEILLHRQKKLMAAMLIKMYDPRNDSVDYDDVVYE